MYELPKTVHEIHKFKVSLDEQVKEKSPTIGYGGLFVHPSLFVSN
jgi:hypothetical protein